MQTQWIRPRAGRIRGWLVHWLLRLFVKRRMHGGVDVAAIRHRQADINARLGGRRSAGMTRDLDCNGVPAQWLSPANEQQGRVLLHLHGGAFIARSPALHADLVAPWCETLQSPALLPQYRLAPEHRYPTGLEDCLTAYRWLLNQGYSADQIVLSGDSAGGNLALALMLALKANGESLPRCAVLLSPFVDFTLSGESLVSEARSDPMFTPEFALNLRGHYLNPQQILEPTASPLFGDLHGLRPLLIQSGEHEMLRDESVRIARHALAAGVDVNLQIWHDLPHVFQALALLPAAAEAAEHITDFIARHAGWAPHINTHRNPPETMIAADKAA